MIYESLVTFPKVLRLFARELHPGGISEADLLAQLIARHWLTQHREDYVVPPYGMGKDGRLDMKPAIRVGKTRDEIKTYRVAGVEGLPSQAVWTVEAQPSKTYTHLWLWFIAPPNNLDDHYAHHWRGEIGELTGGLFERDDAGYHLPVKLLMEQDGV